ncbi:protein of unknown function [Cupriavidus taiwanensis]|nr:protein of unknown function [Cupriavidus taiwanensis]
MSVKAHRAKSRTRIMGSAILLPHLEEDLGALARPVPAMAGVFFYVAQGESLPLAQQIPDYLTALLFLPSSAKVTFCHAKCCIGEIKSWD